MSTLGTLTDKSTSPSVPTAEFAYIDESGNTGSVLKGGTRTYTLGCVLLTTRWAGAGRWSTS